MLPQHQPIEVEVRFYQVLRLAEVKNDTLEGGPVFYQTERNAEPFKVMNMFYVAERALQVQQPLQAETNKKKRDLQTLNPSPSSHTVVPTSRV